MPALGPPSSVGRTSLGLVWDAPAQQRFILAWEGPAGSLVQPLRRHTQTHMLTPADPPKLCSRSQSTTNPPGHPESPNQAGTVAPFLGLLMSTL